MKSLILLLVTACAVFALVSGAHAQQPADAATGDDYRLGAEDVILIQIWGRSDLSGEFVLNHAGRIQLPMVGEVSAAERTPAELGRYLTERYQLLDTTISEVLVQVTQYNSRSITLVGEVRAPGRHPFEEVPDIWKAILAAGGATPSADLAQVQIVRKDPREGEPRVVMANLSRGVAATDPKDLPALRARDTVVVPSLAEMAVTGDKIQVLGAVRSPGTHRTGAAGTLVEAISASGGALPNADLRKVQLTRRTPGGAIAYQLDLEGYLYKAQPAVDFDLEPGDVITVPSRRTGIAAVLETTARIVPLVSLVLGITYAAR